MGRRKVCERLLRRLPNEVKVRVNQTWFEVYRVAPGVFAIYEPHQWEETITYLIVGEKRALLFDTGWGIGDLKAVTSELTALPSTLKNAELLRPRKRIPAW